eukprot:4589522-Alexandrium_andersonii.AAC.1
MSASLVGSEMCIRDRAMGRSNGAVAAVTVAAKVQDLQYVTLEVHIDGLRHFMPQSSITSIGISRGLGAGLEGGAIWAGGRAARND